MREFSLNSTQEAQWKNLSAKSLVACSCSGPAFQLLLDVLEAVIAICESVRRACREILP
jgi:hypothetical protein